MVEYKHVFDFSNYSDNHFLHNKENKKKLGCMKDETEMLPIIEFIGLRAKCYSLTIETFDNFKERYYNLHGVFPKRKEDGDYEEANMKCKGIKKSVLKTELGHENYDKYLKSNDKYYEIQYNDVRMFKSIGHEIFSVKQNKVSLSNYDNKRYILDNGIDTLPFGHYKAD